MTFKRLQLRPGAKFVNAICTITVIFSVVSCGAPTKDDASEPAPVPTPPVETIDSLTELPVIWSTRTLPAPIRSLGVTPERQSLLLVSYETDQVQVFDLDGEAVTPPSDLTLLDVSNGVVTQFSGLTIFLFPALDAESIPTLIGFSADLDAPLALDFPDHDSPVAGICAAPSPDQSSLLRVAYWVEDESSELLIGDIVQTDDALSWRPVSGLADDAPIAACDFDLNGSALVSEVENFSLIGDGAETVSLRLQGQSLFTGPADQSEQLSLRSGLTAIAPARFSAITATERVSVGSYPNGVIIGAGALENGENRIVFIDPKDLFD